jgi:hypothetical protein
VHLQEMLGTELGPDDRRGHMVPLAIRRLEEFSGGRTEVSGLPWKGPRGGTSATQAAPTKGRW